MMLMMLMLFVVDVVCCLLFVVCCLLFVACCLLFLVVFVCVWHANEKKYINSYGSQLFGWNHNG